MVWAILVHVFDTDLSALDASALLVEAERARAIADAAEVHVLRLAAHWADLHAVVERVGPALPGSERLVRLGGAGTPEVAEFAAAELGAELGTSTHAGQALIADALDLRHRLPLLWAQVVAGEVKPWLARKAAQATRHLSLDLVAEVDPVLARYADRLSWGRIDGLIAATWKRLDPAGAAQAETVARDEMGVWLSPRREHGVATLFARLELLDGYAALGDTRGRTSGGPPRWG